MTNVRFWNAAMALLTAMALVVAPVRAQSQEAPAPGAQTQPAQTRNLKLSTGPDYSKSPRWFPDIIGPYVQSRVPLPPLTNSAHVAELIQDGKLMLSLEDAISLSLENNLSIAVERFIPWLDEASLLLAKSGVNGRLSFDPTLTSSFSMEEQVAPVNSPFAAVGVSCAAGTLCEPFGLMTHTATNNYGYSENFHTGTQFQLTLNTTYLSQPRPVSFNLFNPYEQTTLGFQLTQPLLNGFGKIPNTRYIIEAKNTVKVGESQFAQQVIASVTQTATDYWELVYARENVKVEQAAVATSQKLYEDNKKQLEIGTMAPLDVLTAESQLATDQQNLIVAQTTQLLDETKLLNDITKEPLAGSLATIEIVPTTLIATPGVIENIPIQDAVKEAWQKRPEMQQAELNLKNAATEVKATKNGLLPQLNVFGLYQQTGLGGTGVVCTANCGFLQPGKVTQLFPVGLGYDLENMIEARFPTYEAGINLTLPIRNRAAQAADATAQLNERQQETNYRQLQNTIFLSVRNAQIALQQGRAQVAAAEKARALAQEALTDETKKYQLGASIAYNVVLRERDLTSAQGSELRARINLLEAELSFNQALGRTLDVNHIVLAGLRVNASPAPNIPGTPEMAPAAGN